MSKLRLPNGDAHPDAAQAHLEDALVLQHADRPQSAAYHAGYAVECSLKTLLYYHATSARPEPPKLKDHDLSKLQVLANEAALASPHLARYVGPAVDAIRRSPLARWSTAMRYQSPGLHPIASSAEDCIADATAVFNETVAAMWKDGLL